jgi:uncharacterized protein YidB (DUF937 family)
MGLMDILNGMQNGPRGQRQPTGGAPSGSGGMSPIMMALLGLLAVKAVKHIGSQHGASGGQGRPASSPPIGSGGQVQPPSSGAAQANTSGGLGDILGSLFGGGLSGAKPAGGNNPLSGGLGSLLGGAAAGSVLSGGLGRLINDLQNSGQGRVAQSWIGSGPNQEIAAGDLSNALGPDTIDALTRQTGLSRDELLEGLRQNLPDLVDQLTPNGRLPTEDEASRMM